MTLIEILVLSCVIALVGVGIIAFGVGAAFAFATGHIALGILSAFMSVLLLVLPAVFIFAVVLDN